RRRDREGPARTRIPAQRPSVRARGHRCRPDGGPGAGPFTLPWVGLFLAGEGGRLAEVGDIRDPVAPDPSFGGSPGGLQARKRIIRPWQKKDVRSFTTWCRWGRP